MAVSLPNGSQVHIASGYSESKTMSVLTNANPAVATLGDSPDNIDEGDFIEVISGWSRLTEKIVRVGTVVGDTTFELEGINTTDTGVYPAGSGTGSVRQITGWTQLQQILNPQGQGGEQQFLEYQFLEADAAKRIPTFKSASGWQLQVADDPSLAGFILAQQANDDRSPRAIRITLPNGSLILFSAIITLAPTPNMTINELMTVQVTFSFQNAEPVRYAS